MVGQGNRRAFSTFSTFSSLRRFAKEGSGKAAEEEARATQEHCDLCGEPIPPEHRHLLEVSTREIMCACRPCSILFDSKRSEEHTSELQSRQYLVCRLLLEKTSSIRRKTPSTTTLELANLLNPAAATPTRKPVSELVTILATREEDIRHTTALPMTSLRLTV